MPTEKPRFSITLDPSDLAVLDRFAAAAGQPRASFVAAMISAAVPEFERAAAVMELAKNAPSGVVQGVIDDLSNATTDAMGMLASAVDQTGALLTKVRGTPAGSAKREHRRAEGARLRDGAVRSAEIRRKPGSDPHSLTGGSK